MNIEEIIDSGILMDYCLGLLKDEERKKVEQLSLLHPEIAGEIKALKNGLENYALKKTSWKKDELKKKIWATIDKINQGEKKG